MHLLLIKFNRFTAWLLLGMIVIYLSTGFSLCGKLHVDRLIPAQRALALHKSLVWPLTGLFLAHTIVSIYFAMRRWGWIGRKNRL